MFCPKYQGRATCAKNENFLFKSMQHIAFHIYVILVVSFEFLEQRQVVARSDGRSRKTKNRRRRKSNSERHCQTALKPSTKPLSQL